MIRPNIYRPEFDYPNRPQQFTRGESPFGRAAGGSELAVRYYEVPAGSHLCPYHYEYVEEWILLVKGSVTVRTPTGEESLQEGELMRFPPGPDGAHQITAVQTARMVMFSAAVAPSVCVYPDSDKINVWAGPRDDWTFRRAEANVDYFEGEV